MVSELVKLEEKQAKLEFQFKKPNSPVKTTTVPYEVKLTNYGKNSFLFMLF